MINPPPYFRAIRDSAARRWDQLEADPDLAGPWHQLFKQVQSPRHVVSELLQNADDAKAVEAVVKVDNGEFNFCHDGMDFNEANFTSLCRFGYSDKRTLHTIGFRGIGFKSTFSLGDEVRLVTPSLSVSFSRDRFTEPRWVDPEQLTDRTRILVAIKDHHRKTELEKNLEEWLRSPVSNLFFQHIRCLHINGKEVRWETLGAGPVEHSTWMALSTARDERHLLLRSEAVDFPAESLREIRNERMVSVDEEHDLPPCRVEIVLGIEGRLFVVLPTGVKIDLPFACNAPFIQDPARVKIKDPEISPTNRWLLTRSGQLAAGGMLSWLSQSDASVEERASAYDLLPDVDRNDGSLEGTCARIVEEAVETAIDNQRLLLTEGGDLVEAKKAVAVPSAILDTWSPEQVSTFFDDDQRPVLSRHIATSNRSKLSRWDCIGELDKASILGVLKAKHLPKPDTWAQLLSLWAFVSSDVAGSRFYRSQHRDVRIVPVQGKEVLHATDEVIRLGEKRVLQSQSDWEFLADYLLVLNQNWTRFLAEKRRKAEESGGTTLAKHIEAAYELLESLNLDKASDAGKVIQRVAARVFAEDDVDLLICVRLAKVAATLNAEVGDVFEYVTQDDFRKPVAKGVVADLDGDLDTFVAQPWYESHALHATYLQPSESATEATWRKWVQSGRAGIKTFVGLTEVESRVWGRDKLGAALLKRGFDGDPSFHYVTHEFFLKDWDFDQDHWKHWRLLAEDDIEIWGRLLGKIIDQPSEYWTGATSSSAWQIATTGSCRKVTHERLLPAWIIELRGLPCLQDTWGHYRHPAELLRRTPETETLLDVEPFVRAAIDTEANRELLTLLGVRDTPTGPGALLERLRALAGVENPPVPEVEKWYRRIDHLLHRCETEEVQTVREAFREEKIILTESRAWVAAPEVFLSPDEGDVPGAAVVYHSVRDLALWRRIGVAERPSAELAIAWLKSLTSGQALSQDEVRRVRAVLPRFPERIWHECEHWLNLEIEWVPTTGLDFSLTMQSLVPWKHLFTGIKRRTADFQKLGAEACGQPPFSQLRRLSEGIEERFSDLPSGLPAPEAKPWLNALGTSLNSIILEDEEETSRIRTLGVGLARTMWQVTTGLETVPYIDGTPAGTPRRVEALWREHRLFVAARSAAKAARAVAQELGRAIGRPEINDAIKLCYDRSPEFVFEYFAENFELSTEREDLPEPEADDGARGAPDQPSESEPAGRDHTAESNGDFDAPWEDEEEDPGQDEPDESGKQPETRRRRRRPKKPDLMQLFARRAGFTPDSSDRFFHSDGSWIQKVTGEVFPWERRARNGEIVRHYWPKRHHMEQTPLQLAAEVWGLCDRFPDKHSLILCDQGDNPIEISGVRLRQLRDEGSLTIHPATFRLVLEGR